MELGGKCPVYLDSSANLNVAAKRILWGKMANLGQTCVAPDYILCTEDVKDKFVAEAKKVYQSFYGGDRNGGAEVKSRYDFETSSFFTLTFQADALLAKESPDVCRIVNERNFDRLMKMLKSSSATVEFGGE